MKKIPKKYEKLIFALLMSFSTAFIVSFFMTLMHQVSFEDFLKAWLTSLLLAWPFVFFSILFIAPKLQKFSKNIIE